MFWRCECLRFAGVDEKEDALVSSIIAFGELGCLLEICRRKLHCPSGTEFVG